MENNVKSDNVTLNDEVELKRVLKLPTLIFMGVAYLSPGCVFLYFGVLNVMSGGHFPLVILITMLAMLLTAISYAKMTKIYPVAGSVYSYVQKSMNPILGFVVGWAMMADYLLLPMITYLSFGLYLNVVLPSIPIWVFVIIGVVIVMIFNIVGVSVAGKVDSIITILGLAFVIVSVIAVVNYVLGGGGTGTFLTTEVLYNKETFAFSGVLAASAIMCVGFLGFDSVTTMAEETIEPEKNLGRAVICICVGAGVLFALIAFILNCAWPTAYLEVTNPDTAVTELFEKIGQPIFNYIFIFFNTVACIAICITGQLAVSRIMYGMGRDGFLPKKVFGYLHPKFKTPIYNIMIAGAFGLTAIIFQNNLQGALSLVSFGALTGFFFVNLTVVAQYFIKEKQRSGSSIFKYLILPLAGAAVILYLFLNLENQAKILGAIWLAVGIIYALIKTKGFRELPPEIGL